MAAMKPNSANHVRNAPEARRGALVFAAVLLAACAAAASAATAGYDFARYQVILDKKPFGEVAPSESAPAQAALGEIIARDLEMKSIIDEGSVIRVGILDKKVNKNFSIGVGENYEGIQLVSVNYDNEEAVIKKGTETAVLKLRPDKDKEKAAAPGPLFPVAGAGAAAAPAGPPVNPFAAAIQEATAGGRKPFFTDLKKRRTSPFQPMGTNNIPFQAKPLDSFFKVSTGAFPQARSPFGPFQAPQGSAPPGGFQPLMTASGAPNPFVTVTPPAPGENAEGRGATINQFIQEQAVPPQPDALAPVEEIVQ